MSLTDFCLHTPISSHTHALYFASAAADILRLKDLQPGKDGSDSKPRAESTAYDKAGLEAATQEIRDRVVQECMCAIKSKTTTKAGMSETQFDSIISGKAQTLSRCQGAEDRAVGALLPKTYRSVLSLLEGEGVMKGFMKEGTSILKADQVNIPVLESTQQHSICTVTYMSASLLVLQYMDRPVVQNVSRPQYVDVDSITFANVDCIWWRCLLTARL